MFGSSKTNISSAQGESQASINSSGWVFGVGDATGGTMTSGKGFSLPWYGYMSLAVIGLAWWHYSRRGGK